MTPKWWFSEVHGLDDAHLATLVPELIRLGARFACNPTVYGWRVRSDLPTVGLHGTETTLLMLVQSARYRA